MSSLVIILGSIVTTIILFREMNIYQGFFFSVLNSVVSVYDLHWGLSPVVFLHIPNAGLNISKSEIQPKLILYFS